MKKKKHTFRVDVDMKWSIDYIVKATTAGEAKKKAWARFKRSCPRRLFELLADKE